MSHTVFITLLLGNTILNVLGITLLRHSLNIASPVAAVLGCLCWAGTSAVFLMLLSSGKELAVLATVTASLGFIAVIFVGLAFGEELSLRQLLAITLLVAGIALLSLPKAT